MGINLGSRLYELQELLDKYPENRKNYIDFVANFIVNRSDYGGNIPTKTALRELIQKRGYGEELTASIKAAQTEQREQEKNYREHLSSLSIQERFNQVFTPETVGAMMIAMVGGKGGPRGPGGRPINIAAAIRALPPEQQERLLYRIMRGDNKGRPYGTPRNPGVPPIDTFNPRIEEVRAGDLEKLVVQTKHGIFPKQARSIRELSNDEIVRFQMEDPISGAKVEGGLSLTGGHHRIDEIVKRVNAGQLPPSTLVPLLIHD
jgi:hypothetical protein